MIKFIIDKIHLRNVRCYGDDGTDMDFPLGNLTVFTGSVGAGKSTILKSVSMALYGEDGGVKGEKLSIDDMVNERVGKNLEIELYFHSIDTLKDNHQDNYEIHLYHKHSKYQNKLVFIKNGKDISANGKMDTYRLIEKTIIPKDVYHNIYYFTQQAKNFFTALPNSEQKAIFDSILDLSDYDKYYQNCRTNIQEYEKLISESSAQLAIIKNNINEKTNLIEQEKNMINSLKSENEKLIKELKSKLSIAESELKEIETNSILDFNIVELTERITKMKSEFDTLSDKLESDIKLIQQKIEITREQATSKFNTELMKAKEKLEPITSDLKNKIKELENQKTSLSCKNTKDIADHDIKVQQKISDIKNQYSERIDSIKNELNALNNEYITYKADIDKKTTQFKNDAELCKNTTTIEKTKIDKEISELTHNISYLQHSVNDYQNIIKNNTKELESDHPVCDKCGQELVDTKHLIEENSKLTEQCHLNNDEIAKNQAEIENFKKNKEDLDKQLQEKLNKIKSEFSVISAESKIYKENFQTKINDLNKKIADIESEKESEILQNKSLFENQRNDIIRIYESKINELDSQITKLNQDIETETLKVKQEVVEISKSISKERDDVVSSYQKMIIDKQNEKSINQQNISNEISNLRNKKLVQEENERKLNLLKSEVDKLKMLISTKSEFKLSEETLLRLIESKAHDEETLEGQNKHHDDLNQTLGILEFWKTAFSDSGIKSMLIDVAIPHMNRCAREELERVCPGTFTVSFDTLSQNKSGVIRDKFAINITHNIKCATGHKKLSGGEKRIIDFCCMSALRSLAEKLYGKMFCHIFYDEVLDSLDSECRELFCRSMKTQSSEDRHILLVTHALTEDVEPDRVFPF